MFMKSLSWSGTTSEQRESLRLLRERLEEELYGKRPSIWEVIQPKRKGKEPYEFSSDPDMISKVRSWLKSGSYTIIHDGYKYWIMKGGVGRRKVKEE